MQSAIIVAIGANLPRTHGSSPLDACWAAIEQLCRLPSLRLQRLSHWYQSAPIPASSQPDFVNGAALFFGDDHPRMILTRLHDIENWCGRVRTTPNAARVLDLDLLAVGDTCCHTPELTLPHPRLHQRAFVLHPLCDLDPAWRHPRLGLTAAALRERITDQRIRRLPDRASYLP